MAWSAITNAEIDPESPGTTGLFAKYRDNQEALYDGWDMVIKAVTEIDNSGVLQDDDELVFAVGANQRWWFEMVLLLTIDGALDDFQFDFTFPVGTTYMITHDFHTTDATEVSGYTTEASGATATGSPAIIGEPAFFHGWIATAAAAGAFQLQWSTVANNTWARVLAGSYLVAHQDYSTI